MPEQLGPATPDCLIWYASHLRNLCALAWMQLHPGGLVADFKKYFDHLPPDEMKVKNQVWKEKEKAAVSIL